MRLKAPDDVTAQALKRLRQLSEGERMLDWLRRSLAEMDEANRSTVDGVQLRMGQGAALTLASFIEHVEGKVVSKGVLRDTRDPSRAAQSDTTRRTS